MDDRWMDGKKVSSYQVLLQIFACESNSEIIIIIISRSNFHWLLTHVVFPETASTILKQFGSVSASTKC